MMVRRTSLLAGLLAGSPLAPLGGSRPGQVYGPSILHQIRTAPNHVKAREILNVNENTQASADTRRKWQKAVAKREAAARG
jgi:hypothetical protein